MLGVCVSGLLGLVLVQECVVFSVEFIALPSAEFHEHWLCNTYDGSTLWTLLAQLYYFPQQLWRCLEQPRPNRGEEREWEASRGEGTML